MFPIIQKQIKVENTTGAPCSGCLNVNRRLSPLDENIELFYLLLGPEFSAEDESKLFDVHLCWECRGILDKVHKYQVRFQNAQMVLQKTARTFDINKEPSTLSNFTIQKLNTQENSPTEDDKESKLLDNIIENLEYEGKSEILENEHDIEGFDDFDQGFQDHSPEIKLTKTEIKLENVDNQSNDSNANKSPSPSPLTKNSTKKQLYYPYDKNDFKNIKPIKFSLEDNADHYIKIKLTRTEYQKLVKRDMKSQVYTSKPYKCKECVIGFEFEHDYSEHIMQIHDRCIGDYSCNKCNMSFNSKEDEVAHTAGHYMCYKCGMCRYKTLRAADQRLHVLEKHRDVYKCEQCRCIFAKPVELCRHKRDAHSRFVCEHCGQVTRQKITLVRHISRNHMSAQCKICKRTLSCYDNLKKHYLYVHDMDLNGTIKKREKSPTPLENMYCVECDKQYLTTHKYKQHLRNTARHGKNKYKNVACPECGKVFSRTNYMNNHYKMFHEKKTNNYCQLCDKYYSTGFSLRQHKTLVHDKIPLPRDKICAECGRAFALNRTLIHHMRTHTGERPHACAHCPARFAQRTPLLTHVKAIHGKRQTNAL